MKKRTISFLLVFAILFSLTSLTAFSSSNLAGEKDYLFLDDFDKKHGVYSYEDYMQYYYDELYYHHIDENDPDSEIDWAITYIIFYPMVIEPMNVKRVILDRVILSCDMYTYRVKWALYDAQTNDFISLEKVDVEKYDGLAEGLEKAKVGYPFGDADFDSTLTVLDATYIQQALCGLCEFEFEDDLTDDMLKGTKYDKTIDYISDIDHDGERTVLDATAIQYKLAGLEV